MPHTLWCHFQNNSFILFRVVKNFNFLQNGQQLNSANSSENTNGQFPFSLSLSAYVSWKNFLRRSKHKKNLLCYFKYQHASMGDYVHFVDEAAEKEINREKEKERWERKRGEKETGTRFGSERWIRELSGRANAFGRVKADNPNLLLEPMNLSRF